MAGCAIATLALTFAGRELGTVMLKADYRTTRDLGGMVGRVLAAR